jgi:hypothetical protein
MAENEDDEIYEIGYGKPPKGTRFRAGVSGNPAGRPAGSCNAKTLAERVLNEEVVINENGRRKRVTKKEATFKQLANKSASGDLNATRLLLPIMSAIDDKADESPQVDLDEADQKVLQRVLRKLAKSKNGGNNDENK